METFLASTEATEALGARLAACLEQPLVIWLSGTLGAGKTTLVRGLLRGMGHAGPCRSPTYTIVEPYEFERLPVYHFDLYRLGDPAELEFIGIRDYLAGDGVSIFEWPERGAGCLPEPDLEIRIEPCPGGRQVRLDGRSEPGASLCVRVGALEK